MSFDRPVVFKNAADAVRAKSIIRLNLVCNRMDEMSTAEHMAWASLRMWRTINPDEILTQERIEYYLDAANAALEGN